MNREISVEKIVGRWTGSTDTGLMQRCREAWHMPLKELSDLMVATLLNQKIAVPRILIEAEYRLANTDRDDSELFENQLQEAVTRAKTSAI
jgi:hypothetical protein